MEYLTTQELEKYINELYEKLRPLAIEDDIYKHLRVHSALSTPRNEPGTYCFSDEEGYHYCNIGERGERYYEVTKDLFEVVYWILKTPISLMSSKYKNKHEVPGQDFRRIMFEKELQFFELLKNHPYEDE